MSLKALRKRRRVWDGQPINMGIVRGEQLVIPLCCICGCSHFHGAGPETLPGAVQHLSAHCCIESTTGDTPPPGGYHVLVCRPDVFALEAAE